MAGKRALGINAVMAAVFEAANTYGTTPGDGFLKLPFVSSQLGEERPLIEDDQLGFGREGLDPTYDVATNAGDVVVPLDTRAIGFWLKLLFGDPTTAAKDAASGSFAFTAQPAVNSTITVGGTVFTFVAAAPAANQIQIGANLAATLAAAVVVLNASATPAVAAATYAVAGSTITVTFDATGTAGNAMTLAASNTSNAKASGATLSGGTNTHTFGSGEADLPSASIEIGMPEVPDYAVHYGARANQLRIGMARSGMLNAVLSLIAKGEAAGADAPTDAEPTELRGPRFAQATGYVKMDGAVLGGVVSANMAFSNMLEPVETIAADGRIEDADPGKAMTTAALTIRYSTRALRAKAESGVPVQLKFGWVNGAASLIFTLQRVFLPKTKNPIEGPKGVQASYNAQASGANGQQLVAVLTNDVDSY